MFEIPLPPFMQEFLQSLLGPEAGEIASIPVRSFSIMVMVGFFAGLLYTMRLAKLFGREPDEDPQRVGSLGLWILLGIVLGGRLLYVAVHPEEFMGQPARIFEIWRGGMVFYGGFIAALLLGLWRAKAARLERWAAADYVLVAGFLGYAIGRVGCFLAGDDYGSLAEDANGNPSVPWAVKVPDPLPRGSAFPPVTAGHYLHPTQLYLSLLGLFVAGSGRWLLERRKFAGQAAAIMILLYAAGRFVIEYYRGDDFERGIFGPFSTSQWIALFTGGAAIALLWYLKGKNSPVPKPLLIGYEAYRQGYSSQGDPESLAYRLEKSLREEEKRAKEELNKKDKRFLR